MRIRTMAAALATALVTALTGLGPAGAVDLHATWDGRCAECHGHSADFARRFLRVDAGRLSGPHHGADLPVFLAHHYLDPALVTRMLAMLQEQVTVEPRYRERCLGCHGTAAALARETLALRDGQLVGVGSGRPVAGFLTGHARLGADEVAFFVELLRRVEREVHAP